MSDSKQTDIDIYEVFNTKFVDMLHEKQKKLFNGSRLSEAIWTDPPVDKFQDAIEDKENQIARCAHLLLRKADGSEIHAVDEFRTMPTLMSAVVKNKVILVMNKVSDIIFEGHPVLQEELDSQEGKPHS